MRTTKSPADEGIARGRAIVYAATFVVLLMAFAVLRGSSWTGSSELHSVIEGIATVLGSIIGTLALVRFYSKKESAFLFLGAGFLGTALLDGYHAIVTAPFFPTLLASPPPSLIPWSWLAPRLFLSLLLWLTCLARRHEEHLGARGRSGEAALYLAIGALALVSFLFFALVPLPPAYDPAVAVSRPQEFVPTIFFLLALAGYWRGGGWRTSRFEHWLLLSILVGLLTQVPFMVTSQRNFDAMFDAAHTLKIVSYGCVFVALATGMYELFRHGEENLEEMRQLNESLQGEIGSRDRAEASLREVLAEIGSSIDVLGTSAANVSTWATNLAASAGETAAAISQTSTTVEEIRHTAEVSSHQARTVADSAQVASRVSQEGRNSTESVMRGIERVKGEMDLIGGSMHRLSEQTQAIGTIVATVDDLAEQSNLLAVNASIQAAKAGEEGKSFAVVAQEVKNLADQSRRATREVRAILNEIQKASNAAVMAAEQGSNAVEAAIGEASAAGESIVALAERINAAAQAAMQIAASAQQQLTALEQVGTSMESLKQAGAQGADGARQLEAAAQSFNELGQRLKDLLARYRP